MSTKTVAIAYNTDNQNIAQQIDDHISKAKYSFNHFQSGSGDPLSKQLNTTSTPILLLISDNFLKSATCMSKGLKLLQEKKNNIIPVVINGIERDENGQISEVPTEFDKVSDIIQYINYWQDQYLDLRRQKRKLRDSDDNFNEEKFNEHLQIMRDISTEAGEFLRMLRNMVNRVNWEVFSKNNYELFFKLLGDPASWENIRHLTFERSTPVTAAPTAEPIEEEAIDISDIPGIDLLPNEADTMVEDEPLEEVVDEIEESLASPVLELGDMEDQEEEDYVDDIEEVTDEEVQSIIQKSIRYIEAEKPSAAFDYMEQAIDAYPNSVDLRYHYAVMLSQNGRNLDQSLYHLDLVLEMEPSFADAHYLKGNIAESREDYANAIRSYQKTIRFNDTHSDAFYHIGLLFAKHVEDGEEKGADYLKKAIKYNPGHLDANYQLGSIYYENLNKPNKALKQFEKALEIEDQHPFANYDMALIYYQKEAFELANAFYQKAIAINPDIQTAENDAAFALEAPIPVSAEEVDDTNKADQPAEELVSTPKSGKTIKNEQDSAEKTVVKPIINEDDMNEKEEALASIKEIGDPINALKANIKQLEELLRKKEQDLIKREESLKAAKKAESKTVLITGASAGIGKATAEVFAENGYRLILTGRRSERLEEIKTNLISNFEIDVETLSFDVTNAASCQKAIQQLPDAWRNIDILVNNAGKAKGKDPIHQGRLDHWEEMIDTNIKGLLYMSRAVSPLMVKRETGHIINVCSLAGKEVYPNGNVYCATKHAVDALTKGMQLDLHQYNVRVSQVSPAMVEETEFAKVRYDGDEQKAQIYDGFQPLKAKDVGQTIHFIATQPTHVNIQDVVMMGVQQPNSVTVDRSGRDKF
ncbi:MAG: SDR family NAD(P)-dependent oxidoreductase [Saprospiraceae bacterium]|nr:SDR family NAD(P)-dependent oxidoreductase [Saprospiraceae bacterium]